MKTVVLAAAIALAVPFVVTPAAAVVVTTAGAVRTFDTAFVPQQSAGAFPGVLRVSISKDRIVSRPDRSIDGGVFRTATLAGSRVAVTGCTYTFRAHAVRS